ncbi:DUF1293 family protein [Vibrio coralliirubri]|uniref:DUF1293 family protein n=1 Tax=Vibrio coralliirubri TaxID=1516159 RepID=UPI002FD49E8B
MGYMIHGIRASHYKNSGNINFELGVARPVNEFENDNMHIFGVGSFDAVSEYEKGRGAKPRMLEPHYANELIKSGAFVPYEEYDMILTPDPEDPVRDIVTKLIPVKPEIQKHFEASLKNKA